MARTSGRGSALRTRSGILIAAAAVTTSFFGGRALGGPLPLPAIHRDLALNMSASYAVNARQLRLLTIAFRIGAVVLVGEVVAWVVGIVDEP